jgi:hypothetical protein
MTFTGILLLLFLAAIFATLAQFYTGYSAGGWLIAAILGFVGGFLFLWIAIKFKLPPIIKFHIGPQPFPLAWIVLGAAGFVFVFSLLKRAIVGRVE